MITAQREQFVEDERPWLLTSVVNQTMLTKSRRVAVTFAWVNYGRSPATHVHIIATIRAYGDDVLAPSNRPADAISAMKSQEPTLWAEGKYSESTIAPNGQGTPMLITTATGRMNPAAYHHVVSTDWGWVAVTEAIYSDRYGNNYETGVCLYRLASGPGGNCPTGNYQK
jgi:hypothetical protein